VQTKPQLIHQFDSPQTAPQTHHDQIASATKGERQMDSLTNKQKMQTQHTTELFPKICSNNKINQGKKQTCMHCMLATMQFRVLHVLQKTTM
jgi:hypothetical protein